MKKLLSSVFIIFAPIVVYCQELPKIIQPSPEVAALAKFIDIPVNYSNGIPDIKIPFYTIKTKGGEEIPIYISYHASGIKVNEHATQVGLGWKLSTGGMISVQTYGESDINTARMYPNHEKDLETSLATFDLIREPGGVYCASNEVLRNSYQYALDVSGIGVTSGQPKVGDAQPDVFYYETPLRMGRFVLDSERKAHSVPYAPITIKKSEGTTGNYLIIDEKGNKYEYGSLSFRTIIPQLSPLDNTVTEEYKLSKIRTLLGEEIKYRYSNEVFRYKNPTNFIDYTRIPGTGCGDKSYSEVPNETKMLQSRLDKIEFEEGTVEFYYSTDERYKIENDIIRKDLPGASALRRIVVYDHNYKVIKDFELFYSYFDSNFGDLNDPDRYRLRLDKVVEKGELPYTLIYNEDGDIPHRLSTRQDYWGYYGGTGGLIPSMHFQGKELPGSDRSVDESLIKIGALEGITYPTGGSTHFYFNENTYKHPQKELEIRKNRTSVFNTIGRHSFVIPKDSNGVCQVVFNNKCGNFSGGITADYCFLTLRDENNRIVLQTEKSGVYDISIANSPIGSNYTFTLEGNSLLPYKGSVYMQGEEEVEVTTDKKTQLPGLRLDRMVKKGLYGKPITTKYDYYVPGTTRISKNSPIPVFYYIQEYITGLQNADYQRCKYLVRKGNPVISSQSIYEYVQEYSTGNGAVKYHFVPSSSFVNNKSTMNIGFKRVDAGKLLSKEITSESGVILFKEERSYLIDYSVNKKSSDYREGSPEAITLGMSFNSYGGWSERCINYPTIGYNQKYFIDFNIYNINGGWVKNDRIKKTTFFYDKQEKLSGSNVETANYTYANSNHLQLTELEITNSKGELLRTETKYADDVGDSRLIAEHRIAEPIEIRRFKGD
ncbi:hypothetical protein, partial [Tenacibaculum maritimum]|uniref:hypothetical protein n=2 Tax=Tenacibaculum maritimum TaxID=107401 RepID=UPI00191619AC